MNCMLAVALAALWVAVPLAAQAPPQGREREAARVDERAQTMRSQIGAGKSLQSHVRVIVRLKNGNKLVGVVKDGRLVERVDGLRFVDAHAQDRGAGVRLWYTGGKRNYVFVPFLDFSEYEVLAQLSDKQIDAIEQEMQMAERRAAERDAAAQRAAQGEATPPAPAGEGATPPSPDAPAGEAPGAGAPAEKGSGKTAKGKAGKDAEDGGAIDPAKVQQLQQRTWFALVQEYPPAGGWNKQRRDDIKRRKAVVGTQPSPAELRFVEVFEQWQKACEHFDLATEAKPAAEGEEEGGGSRRSRRGK
jgi:hypothetical protein